MKTSRVVPHRYRPNQPKKDSAPVGSTMGFWKICGYASSLFLGGEAIFGKGRDRWGRFDWLREPLGAVGPNHSSHDDC